nr:MAG: hypothetical protein EDM05_01550 [Leptolyngbya sp. IPPAS B-1204]
MVLEVEGEGAVAATEELLQTPGIAGNWEPATEEPQRDGVLATIATIVGITVGVVELAEKIYHWYQKRRQQPDPTQRIERAMLIGRKGQRILLKNATIEQICRILDE